MRSVLITGAFGQVGSALSRIMYQEYKLTLTGRTIPPGEKGICLDIRNALALGEVIKAVQPDVIIHLAAMTSVDGCELEPECAAEVNIAGVEHVCSEYSGHIIYLSTDYVFNGKNGPYSETDPTDPINVYGATKLAGERILLENNPGHLVLRSNVVYDYNPHTRASFLNWVIQSLKNKQEIQVVHDQINNPTWAESLARVIKLCIEKEICGVAHWGDADYMNRLDFAVKIANTFDLNADLIKPITTEELNQPAQRPLNSGLKTDYLKGRLGITPLVVEECLEMIRDRILQ